MIPKQLFFIWLGDNKPNYVDFSVEMFKKVNPEFVINLLEWKSHEIDDIFYHKDFKNQFDEDLYNSIVECLNFAEYSYDGKLYKMIRKIGNYLRFYLVYKYGGIYLDCDTFPIKPFNQDLLDYESFQCHNGKDLDCFFFGSVNNLKIFRTPENVKNRLPPNGMRVKKSPLRNLFFNCQLKYGQHFEDPKTHYIDHYLSRRWIQDINNNYNIIEKIKLDDELRKRYV